MTTFNWTISALDCEVSKDGLSSVVTTVHWRYNGTNEDGISAEVYGAQGVGEPNPDAFTPYPDLSEDQVIGWMESVIDMEAMNANIDAQIEAIIHPINETLPLPWSTPVPPTPPLIVE